MATPFLGKLPHHLSPFSLNLFELGYRSLYLHVGEKPLLLIFSLGFRSVVEVSDWCKEHLGYKVVWVTPYVQGFTHEPTMDIVGCDLFTACQMIGLRENKENITALMVHMAAPHTGPWKFKKRIPTAKVICFLYDIMSLWVPKDGMDVWAEYGDAKGSNPAEYDSLAETLRGDYIEGLLYKDYGPGWPLIEAAGVPSGWWPSTISEKLYQKPPAEDFPWESFIFIGTIMPKRTHDRPSGLFSDIMMENIFRDVALQGFPVHAYILNPDKDVITEYRGLFPGSSGVKMLPGANLTDLMPRVAGRYKWGWMMYRYPEPSVLGLVENSLPTKVFTYMGLCVPIIVSEEMKRVAHFVKEHGIGVVVTQRDISHLREKLASVDHAKLVRNIIKVRPRFCIESMTEALGTVVKTVMDGERKPIPEKPAWLEVDEKIEKEREARQKKEKTIEERQTEHQEPRAGWRT